MSILLDRAVSIKLVIVCIVVEERVFSFKQIIIALLVASLSSISYSKDKSYNFNLDHVPGEIIVRYKGELPPDLKPFVKKEIIKQDKDREAPIVKAVVLSYSRLRTRKSMNHLALNIERYKGVVSVEANNVYELLETTPNDPKFNQLYAMKNNLFSSGLVAGDDIGATKAWDISVGSRDVIVSVLDTGVDYNHPDLRDNMWTNSGETGLDRLGRDKRSNGIDDDGNGYIDDWRGWDFVDHDNDPMDEHSHGTHCAGIIGAVGDNNRGVVGVNWQVSMMPVRILSSRGKTTTASIVEGIRYATKMGAHISSNSWGSSQPSEVIRQAVAESDRAGVLFVAAAGNDSRNNDITPVYPASLDLDTVISVASVAEDGALSSFSNFGKTVDVAAPGSHILSTIPGDSYDVKSGTSMAAPIVAGMAALIKSVEPELTALGIKERILKSSFPTEGTIGKVRFGRVSLSEALNVDQVAPASPHNIQVNAQIQSLSVRWNESDFSGNIGQAAYYKVFLSKRPLTQGPLDTKNIIAQKVSVLGKNSSFVEAQLNSLSLNSGGFVSVIAYNSAGDSSAIRQDIPYQLLRSDAYHLSIQDFIADEGSGWTQIDLDDFNVIADNSVGAYAANSNASLTTKDLGLQSNDAIFEFEIKYSLESSYDYLYLEARDSNSDWTVHRSYSGDQGSWSKETLNFNDFGYDHGIQLRFRLKSDKSVQYSGVQIKNIRVIKESL